MNTNEITDGVTSGTEIRKQRGIEISKVARIDRKGDIFLVPSMSGNGRYSVNPIAQTCTCPDYEKRQCKCKHLYAVEFAAKRETTVNADGSTTVTETIAIKATKRTTYPQDWPAYNAAQTNEKDEFLRLLGDLCSGIQNPPAKSAKGGRPPIDLSDAVFSVVFKIYSTVSGRRFMSDLRAAQEDGMIRKLPHFNSIFNYLEKPEMTPILTAMIIESSKPLAAVESDFAIDSSGFTSCRFHRWFDHKYGAIRQEHDWVKVHTICGVKTNVVTAVEIRDRNTNDILMLTPLLDKTAENFKVSELSGDMAYAGVDNFNAIDRHGATPFIAFKDRHNGSAGGLFQKAWHFFSFHKDEFFAHYYKRSNAESTFSMIKAKFGDAIRSKTDVAMKNEALCKVLCHNICCLISAFYELGIESTFAKSAA